jgi:hypothetical protein
VHWCFRRLSLGKRLTKAKVAQTLKNLEAIVEEYGKWCNGECYGYIIETADGEDLDSCWGFIGDEYCMSEARSAADHCAVRIAKEKRLASAKKARETRERNRPGGLNLLLSFSGARPGLRPGHWRRGVNLPRTRRARPLYIGRICHMRTAVR